jgi:hypothetical protein
VLQPAQNTQDIHVDSRPSTGADLAGWSPPTYGTLMAAARDLLDGAVAASSRRQTAADDVVAELIGNRRFLRTAGVHLHLMTNLAGLRVDAISRLTRHAKRLTVRSSTPSAWMDATASVGAAHDLVATHLNDGVPRTPEAVDQLLGPPAAQACRNLTEMMLAAVGASENLMHQADLAYRRGPHSSLPAKAFLQARSTNQALALYGRAAMWEITQTTNPDHSRNGRTVDTLQAALLRDPQQTQTHVAGTPQSALRLLVQLCHDQARGLTSASPASLRDLALLGARINDASLLEAIADDDRPLARLQRAHAADQIDAANAAWSTAAIELTTTVQGLTKAPGPYGSTIGHLLTQPLDPNTRGALATALPALGRDAARTVETLAAHGDLVTLQPIPLQTRKAWRPIGIEHADTIADRFSAAADASARTNTALRDLQRAVPERLPSPSERPPAQLLQVDHSRGRTP